MKVLNRVKKYDEFQRVIKEGCLIRTSSMSLYFLSNNLGYARVGISIPTKSGTAVVRNKMRRQIRAILAKEYDFKQSVDLIFIARKNYDIGKFKEIRADIIELLSKVRVK